MSVDTAKPPTTPPAPPAAPAALAPKRERPVYLRSSFWAPFGVVAVVIGIWYGLSAGGVLNEFTLPTPTSVADSIVSDWGQVYWPHFKTTMTEILLGLVIGIALGVLIGVGIGLQKTLRTALYPLVVASQSLPVLALAPILVIWLGFGIAPKIVIVVQIIFFPVTVAVIQGLASVSSEVLVFGRSLGASSWTLFWKARVPATLPYFFSGLKIASSYAAVAAVIAEWTGADSGLGSLMLRANADFNTPVVFGSVVIVTFIGLALFGIVSILERKVTPWHAASRDR